MKKILWIATFISTLQFTYSSSAISLPSSLKEVVKFSLISHDTATIDTLYTSILAGGTHLFTQLTNPTVPSLQKELFSIPNQLVLTLENNEIERSLFAFDYLPDAMVVDIIQNYLITHKNKVFIPHVQLLTCYQALTTLAIIHDNYSDITITADTKDSFAKALLALIFYNNLPAVQSLLQSIADYPTEIQTELYTQLLRLSLALQKNEITEHLIKNASNKTFIKPTTKEILIRAHTFFQQLYLSKKSDTLQT